MPEPHGDLGLTVPTSADYDPGQADVPRAFRDYTDSLDDAIAQRVRPLVGVEVATGEALELNAALYVDVPGTTLEIAPAAAGRLLVTAVFAFQIPGGTPNSTGYGTISVDGVDQSGEALLNRSEIGPRMQSTVSQVYDVPLSAAAHTIKMRAKGEGGPGVLVVPLGERTRMLYQFIPE